MAITRDYDSLSKSYYDALDKMGEMEGNYSNKKLSNNIQDHYNFEYKGIRIDPYRVLKIYNITDPAHQHAIKKLLRAGRGPKSLKQDLKEARDIINRQLAMMEEDADNQR